MRAVQGRMQRLVTIALGDRDVILETAGDGFEQIMHGTENAVAVIHTVDDYTQGVNIEQIDDVLRSLSDGDSAL